MNPNQQNMWPGAMPSARPAMPPRQPMPPARPTMAANPLSAAARPVYAQQPAMARPAPRPVAPAQPVQPAQPAQTVSPVNPEKLESLADEMQAALNEKIEAEKAADVAIKDNSKKSKSAGMVLVVVLLVLVAAAGVGFGVYTMYDSNEQIKSLNAQITTLKAANDSLTEQIENMGVSNIDDGEEEMNINDAVVASYMNITDWGLKILIPETLKDASFVLLDDGNELAIKGWVGEAEATPEFMGLTDGLGSVKRYALGTGTEASGEKIFSDSTYEYYYVAPQTVYSTDESELELERLAVEAIKQMLTNAENYTVE